jgi:SAM-dependent methyltransferase
MLQHSIGDRATQVKRANQKYYEERRDDHVKPSRNDTLWFQSFLQGSRIYLDAACGGGSYIPHAIAAGTVVAFDIASNNLRFVKYQYREVIAVVGDVENMPFRPETFDYASAFGLLHHLSSPVPAIRQFAQVLRRSGLLFLIDTNLASFGPTYVPWLLALRIAHNRGHGQEGVPPRLDELIRMLRENRLQLLKLDASCSFLSNMASLFRLVSTEMSCVSTLCRYIAKLLFALDAILWPMLPTMMRGSFKIVARKFED